jgi:hypothetical protein
MRCVMSPKGEIEGQNAKKKRTLCVYFLQRPAGIVLHKLSLICRGIFFGERGPTAVVT